MKIKILVNVFFISFILIMQSTLLGYIEVYGVKPNLLLIFVIVVALLRGNVEGATIGFFTGLFQDIAAGKVLGFYALIGFYLGLTLGSINKRLYRENLLVLIFFTFISTFIYEWMVYFFAVFFESNGSTVFVLQNIIFPEAVYNSILSVPAYIIMMKAYESMEHVGRSSRKY